MTNLKKPIGEILPGNQTLVSANESDKMSKVTKLMEGDGLSRDHLSQIPIKDDTGKIRYVVTGYGLARWALEGAPDKIASDYGEMPHPFTDETPLEDIIEIVADFGYVVVMDEDEYAIGILSYTDVIRELAQT